MEKAKHSAGSYLLYLAALVGFFIVSVVLLAPAGHAESASDAANTLKVSPVRSDVQVKPGASAIVKVYVTNITKNKIAVQPIENDFVSGDEKGTPSLILDADKYAPTHSLKRFMVPLNNFVIDPGKTEVVNLKLNVPKNAQAGGYFGAVRFAPSSPDGGGQVNMSASVASLVLLTVPGPTTEKLDLTNFDVMSGSKTINNFSSNGDLSLLLRFENKGNLQEGPFGQINVKKGDKIIYSVDFNDNDPRDMVLPDSARRWTVPLKNIGNFGHYTVSGTLTYGKTNQTIDVSKSFWVIPWKVIVEAAIGLVVLAAIVAGIILFLRGYKKRLLHQYGRGRRR